MRLLGMPSKTEAFKAKGPQRHGHLSKSNKLRTVLLIQLSRPNVRGLPYRYYLNTGFHASRL